MDILVSPLPHFLILSFPQPIRRWVPELEYDFTAEGMISQTFLRICLWDICRPVGLCLNGLSQTLTYPSYCGKTVALMSNQWVLNTRCQSVHHDSVFQVLYKHCKISCRDATLRKDWCTWWWWKLCDCFDKIKQTKRSVQYHKPNRSITCRHC